MRIEYNAPVTLTFALLCTLSLIIIMIVPNGEQLFMVSGQRSPTTIGFYLSLVTHIFGHANFPHLLANMSFILLLGPRVEEKYGSRDLVMMMFVTAVITGIFQIIFFSEGLLGASGIVFMLILISSITNFSSGKIPLTFILVALLYLGTEIWNSFKADQVSQFAHIMGGICGSVFGFWLEKGKKKI